MYIRVTHRGIWRVSGRPLGFVAICASRRVSLRRFRDGRDAGRGEPRVPFAATPPRHLLKIDGRIERDCWRRTLGLRLGARLIGFRCLFVSFYLFLPWPSCWPSCALAAWCVRIGVFVSHLSWWLPAFHVLFFPFFFCHAVGTRCLPGEGVVYSVRCL